MAPADISIGAFLTEIRRQSTIRLSEALYLFCGPGGGILVPTSSIVSKVYEQYKDPDGFLYMSVALENTFGGLQIVTNLTTGMLDRMLYTSSRVARTLGLHILA